MIWSAEEIDYYNDELKKCEAYMRSIKKDVQFSIKNKFSTKKPSCPFVNNLIITPSGDMILCAFFMKFAIIPGRFKIGNVNNSIREKYESCKYDGLNKNCIFCLPGYCGEFCHNLMGNSEKISSLKSCLLK
jgi:radical SAM protein with 4Fe4S-binding SPASM domain